MITEGNEDGSRDVTAALVAVYQELYRRTGVTCVEVKAEHYTDRRLSQIHWNKDSTDSPYVLYRAVTDSEIVNHVRGIAQSHRLAHDNIPFGVLS